MTLVFSVLYVWARVIYSVLRFLWREAKAQSAAWAEAMAEASKVTAKT